MRKQFWVGTRWMGMGLALLAGLFSARDSVRLIAMADKGYGLTLAATTEINTPTQKGKFSWEAYWVDTRPIVNSVWEIPEGYQEIKF